MQISAALENFSQGVLEGIFLEEVLALPDGPDGFTGGSVTNGCQLFLPRPQGNTQRPLNLQTANVLLEIENRINKPLFIFMLMNFACVEEADVLHSNFASGFFQKISSKTVDTTVEYSSPNFANLSKLLLSTEVDGTWQQKHMAKST